MGGPLSRLLADLIIENKIEKVIQNHPKWGQIWDWVRLIDDTLSVWTSKEVFLEFFEFLNTIHDGIKWTNETEEENSLNIFDIQIIRTEEGKYETTVYRKKSASDRYIHFTSSQAWKEKACAIRTLKSRALEYCSTEALLADELSHLLQVFIGNGYPEKTVWRILYEENQKPQEAEWTLENSLYIPYHPRVRRLVTKIKKEYGITAVYKKTQTLGDILLKKGRRVEKEYKKNTVYKIPCAECPKAYVGQSTGTLKKRNQEHANLCKKKHKKKLLQSTKKNDGVAYHHHLTGHQIDFPNTTIIAQETSYWRRLIVEGIEIKKLGENKANLQAGFEINDCWNPYLEK